MKIVFMGTPDFAVPPLKMLVEEGHDIVAAVTRPDKPKGRGNQMSVPPVKEYALKKGLTVLQPLNAKIPDFIEKIRSLSPDLIITAAYGCILPSGLLAIPRLGSINIHASLLPLYRGSAPINRAIMNGDTETGITIMFMDEGMDTGDILLVEKTEIDNNMNAGELFEKLSVLGAEALKTALEKLEKGTLERRPQNNSLATTAKAIRKEEGLIDWCSNAVTIHNKVRGLNPFFAVYTYYKGKRLKICKSRTGTMINNDILDKLPGTIVGLSKENVSVICGNGILDILELQFENSSRMTADKCWHNFRLFDLLESGVE